MPVFSRRTVAPANLTFADVFSLDELASGRSVLHRGPFDLRCVFTRQAGRKTTAAPLSAAHAYVAQFLPVSSSGNALRKRSSPVEPKERWI